MLLICLYFRDLSNRQRELQDESCIAPDHNLASQETEILTLDIPVYFSLKVKLEHVS